MLNQMGQDPELAKAIEYLVAHRVTIREQALAGDQLCQNIMVTYGLFRVKPGPAEIGLIIAMVEEHRGLQKVSQ